MDQGAPTTGEADLLTPLQAAHHLGITPELLTAYSRPAFCKRKSDAKSLRSISKDGRVRYARADLDEFDAYLQQPWSENFKDRPSIPAPVVAHLRAESGNQCVRCGSGSGVENAHIVAWAKTQSHHHHNLLRLCTSCHAGHDGDGIVTTDELRTLKDGLVARTRALIERRISPRGDRLRVPSRASSYFGREKEAAAVVAGLQGGRSLLIVGTGGIGKTELLLQALERAETGRPILWVDVGRYRTTEAVEEALHIALSGDGEPIGASDVAARLDAMEVCLVLDGIEQGLLTDLGKLESRLAELFAATHRAQFVATSQVKLHRFPAEATIVVGPLDDKASMLILGQEKTAGSEQFDELVEICGGHALTLRLASALITHFGTVGAVVRVIRDRGASAMQTPGVDQPDRSTSLAICLAIAFEALSRSERQALLLLSFAPAGLFAKQLEDDYFKIDGGVDAIANLRRWHVIFSDHDEMRERLQTLSPVRMFVIERWWRDEPAEVERLKSEVLNSIGVMVAVISERSGAPDQIGYMIARYSEEMPNIRWLISEAESSPLEEQLTFLGLASCSSLMRYFFVLRLSEEGMFVMRRAAELAIACGRPHRASAFVAQMVGLQRGRVAQVADVAEALLSRIESLDALPPHVLGDLHIAKTMIALDRRDPETAAAFAKSAFEAYKEAGRKVRDRRSDDPEDIDPLPDDLIESRQEEVHNDLASALKLHGDAMLALGRYENAAESYRHSLRHERGAAIAVNRGQTLHQIGNCESYLGNHEKAAEYYLDAMDIFHFVGMREFLSNATGELGFTLLNHIPAELADLQDELFDAALQDMKAEIATCFDPRQPIDAQRCAAMSRKCFGTLNVGIFSGRAAAAGNWALGVATELLGPALNAMVGRSDEMAVRFSILILETPLRLTLLVADLDGSRDERGDPDEGLVRELLSTCCSIDTRAREMLRIAEWLAIYLRVHHGVTNLTAERIREFMTHCDEDIDDELELERAGVQ